MMRVVNSNSPPPLYTGNGGNPALQRPPVPRQASNYAPIRQSSHFIPPNMPHVQRNHSEFPSYEYSNNYFNQTAPAHQQQGCQNLTPVPPIQSMYDTYNNQMCPSRGNNTRMYPAPECVFTQGGEPSDNESFSDSSDDIPLSRSSTEYLTYSMGGDLHMAHKRKRRRSKYSRHGAGRSKINETVVLQLPSQPPKSIPDAVCMYIDYLIAENEAKTDISKTEPINKHMFIRLEDEDYAREALNKEVGFPTPKFQEWLRLYNFEVQVCHSQVNKRNVPQAPLCNPDFGPKPNNVTPAHNVVPPNYTYPGPVKPPDIAHKQPPSTFPPPLSAITRKQARSEQPSDQLSMRPPSLLEQPGPTCPDAGVNQPLPTLTLPPISSFRTQPTVNQNTPVSQEKAQQDEDTTAVAQIMQNLRDDVNNSPVNLKQSHSSQTLNTPEMININELHQNLVLLKSHTSTVQQHSLSPDSEVLSSNDSENTHINGKLSTPEVKAVLPNIPEEVVPQDSQQLDQQQLKPINMEPQTGFLKTESQASCSPIEKEENKDRDSPASVRDSYRRSSDSPASVRDLYRRSGRKRLHVNYTE